VRPSALFAARTRDSGGPPAEYSVMVALTLGVCNSRAAS
jgi:hypothetical protein